MKRSLFKPLFLLLVGFPAIALAQQPSLEDQAKESVRRAKEKNYISVSIENDLLGGGTDQYYTSGVRLTYFNVNTLPLEFTDEYADFLPTFDLNETTSTFFTLGQNIYTPEDITIRSNQDDDRPWAGFLYGSVGAVTVFENHVDELEVTLGVVGPEALGEQTQKLIHRHLSDSDLPKGWKNQLDFEPGLIFSAGRRWPQAIHTEFSGFNFDVEPNINFSLGNIYTYAGAGLSFTLEENDNALRDKPPRVRPAMPGSGYFETSERGWDWLFFAGIDGRLVARDIFLDGNTFSDSHSVDKKHFVADATAGIAFTYDRYRLSYSINARTKEFDGQDSNSVFGSLTVSTRF